MKKIAISLSLILFFVLYSLQQKLEGPESANVFIPSKSTGSINTNNPPPSTSNSSSDQMHPMSNMGGMMEGSYKDGTYKGDTVDAYYGYVQIEATVSNGKIADVKFLQYPNDRRTSIFINSQAMPYLSQEAIQVQNANVDTISGATQTSKAFRRSLQSALDQAV